MNQGKLEVVKQEMARVNIDIPGQYFSHLMWRADSFEKTLMLERLRAGGEGDNIG